jgi:hypothetical protein
LSYLGRIQGIDVLPLYLVRDPRGIVLSNLELGKKGWNSTSIMNMWIHQQATIIRKLKGFPSFITIYYEDLCDKPDETMNAIYNYLRLEPCSFSGDYKSCEHHILGNVMRLKGSGRIKKNLRWQHELCEEDLNAIEKAACAFVDSKRSHPVSAVIQHYLK